MTESSEQQRWQREELLSLLSASGTLAGLCITVVAFMNTVNRAQSAATIVDNMLAICAAMFLLCIYLIFWTLRTRSAARARYLTKIIDQLFLLSLTAMTLAAFIMIYTLW